MSIKTAMIKLLAGFSAAPPERKTTIDLAKHGWPGGAPNSGAGVKMGTQQALQIPAAFACIRLIASGVAALDLKLMSAGRNGEAPRVVTGTPEHRVLTKQPNAWQSPFEFREMLTAHAVLEGNGFALIHRVGGRVDELIPIVPSIATVKQLPDHSRQYVVQFANGTRAILDQTQIFHLPGLSWDGIRGLNMVGAGREALGLAAAAEGTQARSFANGARMPGYWTTEQPLDEVQANKLRDSLVNATTGANQFKSPLLDLGIQYKLVGQTFDDAQLVETRKHQILEVCAIFGVAPAVLGLSDQTQAFASVEAMQRWHLITTLTPWLKRWKARLDISVLDASGPLSVEFDTRDLTKATLRERTASYRALVELGIMTRNEAREMEGLPPLPGLDEPLTPKNMGTGDDEKADSDD